MESTISYWPLFVLLLGALSVVLLIVVLRVHAFIALILSAILVGILSQTGAESGNTWVLAVENTMKEFGVTAGKISFVIAIASVLGIALTESGAAEKIVNQLIKVFGESRAGVAIVVAGFVLSIPVFFDTVFFLLIPIAIALAQKTGKHFLLFVLAIACGAIITHSLVPPTPGPLLMAESLKLDLGLVILVGMLSGVLPAYAGYQFSQRQDQLMPLLPPILTDKNNLKINENLPSFTWSIAPIFVPLVLIITASISVVFNEESTGFLPKMIAFLGNKNVAMFLGLLVALYLWARHKNLNLKALGQQMEKPLEIAGLIILITSAGGAFGAMIRNTGIGEMIQNLAANGFNINLLVVAWLMAALIKFAQGSGTVSVITTAGIMAAIVGSGNDLPYHPVYIFLAIGYGSMVGSWMNDSGFWIVGKLSGMTEKETLSSWSLLLIVLGVAGGIEILLLSYILPFTG